MDSPIEPTVGRVVLFADFEHVTCALVTRVHDNNCINLMVMHDGGIPSPRTSVQYDEAGRGGTWHWMPYQRQVAGK